MFGRKSTRGEKKAAKAEHAAGRAQRKAGRSEKKAAKAAKSAKDDNSLIGTLTNPKTARRALAVAKIAGPAIAPYALSTATAARGFLDDRRAIKLGVTAQEVAAYRGPTGPAGARIATLRNSIDELGRRRTSDLQVSRFADVAKARLADLDIAVHTAASMPSTRRRSTLGAVGKELNQIESDLMTYLVGSPV